MNNRYDLHVDLPNGDHLLIEIDLDKQDTEENLKAYISSTAKERIKKLERDEIRIYHESEFE